MSVKHSDFDWWEFHFAAGSSLSFQSFWRLVSDQGIEITSADDGHQFGLKTPLNAVEILKTKIGETLITDVRFEDATSDLIFYFGPTLRIEVITTSSGYEAWILHTKETHIIGRNGEIVVFPPPNVM